MSYEIVKDIPLPNRWVRKMRYPWYKLEVGDCVVISDESYWRQARKSAHYLNSKRGELMFTTKVQGEKLHIWRVR